MKKSLLKSTVLSLLVVAALTGCKKEKDESVAVTKENLAGTYKMTALTMQVNGSAEENIFDSYQEACQKDDLYKLNADLTFNYVDAGTVCDPTGDWDDVWSLEGTNKINFYDYNFDIVSFTGSTLVASETTSSGGTTFKLKATFVRQ